MLEILRDVVEATNGLFGPVLLFSAFAILSIRFNKVYGWKKALRFSSFLMISIALPLAIASNRYGIQLADTSTVVFFMVVLALTMIPWGD